MSSLWTPGGERPIQREPEPAPAAQPGEPSEEETLLRMAEAREQIARLPATELVAEQGAGFGRALFEIAALHLSLEPPQLDQARVAIDTLAEFVDAMAARLGPYAQDLAGGLAQLQMAFVQIKAGLAGGDGAT